MSNLGLSFNSISRLPFNSMLIKQLNGNSSIANQRHTFQWPDRWCESTTCQSFEDSIVYHTLTDIHTTAMILCGQTSLWYLDDRTQGNGNISERPDDSMAPRWELRWIPGIHFNNFFPERRNPDRFYHVPFIEHSQFEIQTIYRCKVGTCDQRTSPFAL